MTKKYRTSIVVSLTLLVAIGTTAPTHASEMDELKATVEAMQKSMGEMQKKIAVLEQENQKYKHQATVSRAAAPVPAGNSRSGDRGSGPAPG